MAIQQIQASPINHEHGTRQHTHALPQIGIVHQHGNGALGKAIFPADSKTIEAKKYGYFSGSVVLEQLPDGRNKRLANTVTFTDPTGKKWIAPKGHVVDGASIPKLMWPIIGSPFTGKYLAASVIHDVACDEKKESWQTVHKVFHHAMLASGVPEHKANLMYKAVYFSGPRWGAGSENRLSETDFKLLIPESILNALAPSNIQQSGTNIFNEMKQWVE